MSLPIIDSHIHLYAASHIDRLNWTADLPPDHALNLQNSVEQYRKAIAGANDLRGFVFLETDRKSGLLDSEWEDALHEVSFLARIAQGEPISGEGHTAEDKKLVLGIVPWAPVAAGPGALARYMNEVQRRSGVSFNEIKGVRYLLQDKPVGTMLAPNFVEGLQWLGRQGLSFDLGVNARSEGLHQLEEACEMLGRVFADGGGLKVIINHMCKPDLHITPEEVEAGNSTFAQWKTCMMKIARYENTYVKVSGMFSELPPQTADQPTDIDELVRHTKPWVDVVFESFGPSRAMFGSDWPVCNMGGPGIENSWSHYVAFFTSILDSQNLNNEEKAQVWSGTAARAYKIDI
jgi:L-rhamnono-1,4-lactonase